MNISVMTRVADAEHIGDCYNDDIRRAIEHIVTPGYVITTPAQMELLRQFCVHDIQKLVRDPTARKAQSYIAKYCSLMQRPASWLEGETISFARLWHRLWLVNGTHRTYAQVMANKTLRWHFRIHDVADENELRALFSKYDNGGRERNDAEISKVLDLASRLEVPQQIANALFRAMPLFLGKFPLTAAECRAAGNFGPDLRSAALLEFKQEALLYARALASASKPLKNKLMLTGPAAVAMITLRFKKDEATQFWNGLAANDGLRSNDPRSLLISSLTARAMKSGGHNLGCMLTALAWNSYLRGEKRQYLRITEGKFTILGTPIGREK